MHLVLSSRGIMAYVVGTTTITPHMKGDDPVKGVLKDIKTQKHGKPFCGYQNTFVLSVHTSFLNKKPALYLFVKKVLTLHRQSVFYALAG